MELEWVDGSVDLRCPVCARANGQILVARVDVVWRDQPVDIARCAACSAVVLGAMLPPTAYTEGDWDFYIEQIAGVEAIADTLAQAGARRGARMLDVGCGYGFALDLGRFLYDWQGVGLDPSIAAARGRKELGLDIRPGTLDDAFEPDEAFDVIFSSEVIEHIAEPREFLGAVRRRLSPDGVLVLTTPDAAVVTPDTHWNTLYPVLSVGLHEFLVDADGFRRLLTDAGFHATVWNVGPSLHAVAALDPGALAAVRPAARVDLTDLARYCDERAATAEPGSALALGMATRHLKWTVSDGAFDRASAGIPALRTALHDRYSIDLDDPGAVVAQHDVPAVLTLIYYFLGLLYLWHERAPRRAAACFLAAASAGEAQFDTFDQYQDPETPAIEGLARAHLALALARFAPQEVDGALAELERGVQHGAGDAELVADTRARVADELAVQRSAVKRVRRRVRAIAGRAKRRLRGGGFSAR